MLFFIPSSGGRKLVAEGSRVKSVTCESCSSAYDYTITRLATGEDKSLFSWSDKDSYKKALDNLNGNLDKLLDSEHDAAPCPDCGWTQRAMVEAVRAQSYENLYELARMFFYFGAGVFVITASFTLLVLLFQGPAKIDLFAAACGVGAALALAAMGLVPWALRRSLNAAYDPNRGRLLEVERDVR